MKLGNNNNNCGLVMHCKVERQACLLGTLKENWEPITIKLGKEEPKNWALGGIYWVNACTLSIY